MTEEQQARLKQIQGRFGTSPATWEDVGFLLSLLDSDSQTSNRSVSQIMADEDECIAREQAALEAGGTRMRDACVEKVRSARRKHEQVSAESEDFEYSRCAAFALGCVEDELTSLTLDQVEQEKR